MKKLFLSVAVLLIMSVGLTSCIDKEKKNNKGMKQAKETTSTTNEGNSKSDKDWKLVWSDEFEGESLDTNNWNRQVVKAGRFNEEWQRYTNNEENAYIEDGKLVLKAIHESDKHGLNQYTSARLNTAKKQSWKYGKIAARIKLPEGEGIWPAFWMLGSNIDENGGDTPWPQCGEIDILELYGTNDDGVVEANLHYADASDSHAQMGAKPFKLKQGKFADAFHSFELEWDENEVVWFVDGEQYASIEISDDQFSEVHREYFLLLNLAVGGTWAGRPDETTKFPQHMYVDWVRVYQKD
ncbi:MAG: glycoside hydrolase family 16 protein [Flavobacteriaceae bacterium]|nr:glycoside hydrolase family 16 protein [Bacteroidia bacterium]NNL15615.1 glycoside hydrolase family 16 protein [Flavobacteriaceae bacterium]